MCYVPQQVTNVRGRNDQYLYHTSIKSVFKQTQILDSKRKKNAETTKKEFKEQGQTSSRHPNPPTKAFAPGYPLFIKQRPHNQWESMALSLMVAPSGALPKSPMILICKTKETVQSPIPITVIRLKLNVESIGQGVRCDVCGNNHVWKCQQRDDFIHGLIIVWSRRRGQIKKGKRVYK